MAQSVFQNQISNTHIIMRHITLIPSLETKKEFGSELRDRLEALEID